MGLIDVQYVYYKTRSEFGKQCLFNLDGPIAVENVIPNPQLRNEFILRNPCHTVSQETRQYAVHEAQTDNVQTVERGMLHSEGGWPADVNFNEEEATTRFRKRVLRSDSWATTMRTLITPMEHCVQQNNTINIYEDYFDEMIPSKLAMPLTARVVNVFADPQLDTRPVTNISWSRSGQRMMVSHCALDFQRADPGLSSVSYLWSIENPSHPLMALKPKSPCVAIEFNPRHSSLLISGLMTGEVASWDLRSPKFATAVSNRLYSHSEPASIVFWIDTKTHYEFSSASTDGLMKWWDMRKIREPTQTLAVNLDDPESNETNKCVGISSVHYTSAMSFKFMLGLENGVVINGSRKAKSSTDMLASRFKCHSGPVVSVQRNSFIPKIFLTIGDWSSRIWAEDTKEGCLTSTAYGSKKDMLTGGCWSNSRISVFYVISSTGEMEIWDLMTGLSKPVQILKLSKDPLTRIKPHENGRLMAVGSKMGNVYLVETSEALRINRKNDKTLLTEYLENCSQFEKSVYTRLKESKLSGGLERENSIPLPQPKTKSTKDQRDNEKRVGSSLGGNAVRTGGEQQKNKNIGKKIEKISVPFDPELIEPENEYFASVQKELDKHRRAMLEEDSDGLFEKMLSIHEPNKHQEHHQQHEHHQRHEHSQHHEHNQEPVQKQNDPQQHHHHHEHHQHHEHHHHHHHHHHNRRSYKKNASPKKYKKPSEATESDSSSSSSTSSDSESSEASWVNEEVIKLGPLPCRKGKKIGKRRKTSKRFPTPCAAETPSVICHPEVCCRDANLSPKRPKSSTSKKKDSPNKIKASSSAIDELSNGDIKKNGDPRIENVTTRPLIMLLEALAAKKRIDQEAERIKYRKTKEATRLKVAEIVHRVSEAQEKQQRGKIDAEDCVDKAEELKSGSLPAPEPAQEAKIRQHRSSPKEVVICVAPPRRALTALQVTPREVTKPLPQLTGQKQSSSTQKESYVDRMYPGSSAFPPLPRIILPKLLDRPPDPSVDDSDERGKAKRVKRKVKPVVNRAEKSGSPNQ